jgi:hypothetical protein
MPYGILFSNVQYVSLLIILSDEEIHFNNILD